ncbi:LysR family transcriptional regulator [Enterococcus hulanensis]|uniref:LysR family transcriptional regulator n=1 Tax=Enterococcus hulanensis TaxID=2559929 RepID=UPI001A8C7EAD|nr:LysR family transcriptional regulator [Enterococcus hulanensis]MBO0458147.1 LysR family transcriptional regulator [Enterococcus hulanensis]
MEIRVLQYFLTVVREGSISAAADSLHITQPTLSRQLKSLEDEFDKQLFIRGKRKIVLTEDGLIFKQKAQEIIDLVSKVENQMLEEDQELSGEIYIGCGESDSMRIITDVIAKVQEEHPSILFHIFSGISQDVKDKLDKGLLDFGIMIGPADIVRYDFIKLPSTDQLGVLMNKDNKLARYSNINPIHLKDQPLIISNQEMVQNVLSGWFGYNDEKMNIVATYNLIYNASLMVDSGVGYAIVLDKLMNLSNSTMCFRPLKPQLSFNLDIIWKKNTRFSKAAEFFLYKLKEEIEEQESNNRV